MGVGLSSHPKTLDNTKLKDGKKRSFKDPVIIRVSSAGFVPSEITVFSGQVICWEWESDDPEIQHNIKQVTISESGQLPIPVPNGLCSGHLCPTGTFEIDIAACGSYQFISEGHSNLRITTIKVVAAPAKTIKVTDEKFEPYFVEIFEGESVTWKWESVKGNLRKIEFCSKHGGITSVKLNPTCDPDHGSTYKYTESFQQPGLYYFAGNTQDQLCVVKVLQKAREYSIKFLEDKAEPSFINGFVGDRVWVQAALPKKNMSMMIKSEDGGILASSRPRGTSNPDRCSSLLSYCFVLPGIYRVVCSYGLSTLQCCVLVQPKPRDYVIKLGPQGFEPELGSVKQGDRIWWMWTGEESDKRGFLIEEKERIVAVSTDFSETRGTDCRCFESNEHLFSIGCFGLLSMIADTPGLFSYRVKAIGDWTPPERDVCSIIVKNVAKNHVVRVSDHGFQPQIVNVHPGESVMWTWRDTNKSHKIQQVSHERAIINDGFHGNFLCASPNAFSHVFTDLGVFYFTSASLSAVYGAVVVTAGNQVHKVEVTLHGVEPDPLGVRVGDIVCWRWSSDQLYTINAIDSPDEIDKIVKNQDIPVHRRCVAETFKITGIHHFVSTAYLGDEDEPEIHPCDSFINTIYVDPAPYSCRVQLSRDGFKPHTVILAKHESVLWSWDATPDEPHNIVLVENPSDRPTIVPVRSSSFFESGPLTRHSSFFHTFDTPGSYWVTSHGTDGKTCRIDVLHEAKRVMSPTITNGSDGGNVEFGYTVFLSCVDRDVDILYTLDGSMPVENLPNSCVYNWQEGIRLSRPGLFIVRAISIKPGWIPSEIFTSRRFWVLDEEEDDSTEEQTTEDYLGLRQEITDWQWTACAPTISSSFVFDNVVRIDLTLPTSAQVSWITGYQLYLNGVPYGGWLCASCPGVEVSGLTGGKVYHVVIVVFPASEEFSPQLTNELIIKCPTHSSFGGPIVSLETCNRVDALVIVWPANQGCLYTILVDGQPMGEQVTAEPDGNDYCRVLFETECAEEDRTFNIIVADGKDEQLLSNEIQFSLPLPMEMIHSPKLKNQDKEELAPEETNPSITPTNEPRELLIVSELSVAVMPSGTENETAPFCPDNTFQSTLDTIHEDKQLDVVFTPPPGPLEDGEGEQQLDLEKQVNDSDGNQGMDARDSELTSTVDKKALVEDSNGIVLTNSPASLELDGDVINEEKQQQLDVDNQAKEEEECGSEVMENIDGEVAPFVNREASVENDVDDNNSKEELPVEQETPSAPFQQYETCVIVAEDSTDLTSHSRNREMSAEQEESGHDLTTETFVDNNIESEEIMTTVTIQDPDPKDAGFSCPDNYVYGPVEELFNYIDSLQWECVLSNESDYQVDMVDEESDLLNSANVHLVKCEIERTKNVNNTALSSRITESDGAFCVNEKSVDNLVCENLIKIESVWYEMFANAKDLETFEETFRNVEESIVLWDVREVNPSVTHIGDDFLNPIVRTLQVYQSTLCMDKVEAVSPSDQEMSELDYHKKKDEIPEGSRSENKFSVVRRQRISEDQDMEGKIHEESCDLDRLCMFACEVTADLKLVVKGTSQSKVVLEWEDKSCVDSPLYCLMVYGEKFSTNVDSQQRYNYKDSPTPSMWPNNQTSIEQHYWTTEQSVIEIHGLRQRHRYRIAVVVSSRDTTTSRDQITKSLRSEIMNFTMPGRPKAPVIHVTALRDREFTISWRPSCSYGEATVIGYRLLMNGTQYGELLPHDAIQHTVSYLQYGTFQHVSLTAVTNHNVGDSIQSNVLTIACPHPPPPPEISETTSTSPHSICIKWSGVTTPIDPDQLKLLSSYDVFVDDVFHGSCPAGDVTDVFVDSFTYTIPACIAGREYSIKVKGHVDPQNIDSSQPAHMCGCYGDASNVLLVRYAGPTCSIPVLYVDSMNELDVNLSWDKPHMYGASNIIEYILRVDGRSHGDVLNPEIQAAKLTSLSLGNDVEVTISALTTNMTGVSGEDHLQGQRGLANGVEDLLHEPRDSGVESSSSVLVDKRNSSIEAAPSAPLTLHLWGFVKRVCDVQVKQICCCSALVEWSLQGVEEKNEGRGHDVFIDPEGYNVRSWISGELAAQELEPVDTSNMNIYLKNLTPLSRYGVVIEAFAHHPNYSENNSNWNISRSDKIWFDTKPPNPPKNIHVISSSLNSICLAWDLPLNDNESSINHIDISVYKKYDDDDDEDMTSSRDALMNLVINPHMTSYTIHNLEPKTGYVFTVKISYKPTDSQIKSHCCGEAVSLEAWTSGVDKPRDLSLTKRSSFSLHVTWKPAVTYGDLYILFYLVHYAEKKNRASHGGIPALNDDNSIRVPYSSAIGPQTEITGLEPGVVYSIVVETVVGLRDKNIEEGEPEEDKPDADDVASSIGSSESDWVSLVCHDCLSKSLTASTVALPGIPVVFVTGISATQIHLAWNKPVSLHLDSEDRDKAERQELRGRVRQISGYSLEVNGRVVTKLPPNKHNFILKRCKQGMKYTCFLVVMTTASDSGGKRSKRVEGKNSKVITAASNAELESDDESDTSFQETRSGPLEVTIPRQEHPLVLSIQYSPTSSTNVSSISSSGSEEAEDGCVVVEWKASTAVKDVSSYEIEWKSSLDDELENDCLLSSSTSYEIYPVKQRCVYFVWLKMVRKDGSSLSWGPLHCQVPGRPDPPWIWCRSVSPHRIIVEWNEPEMYGVDTIRAYQVNLNGRQLGKLLSPENRKVAVHCQPSSVYRIALLALTTDPNLGGSDPSNLLTICTPGAKDKSLDPKQNIRIKPLWAENDSITVEWSDDNGPSTNLSMKNKKIYLTKEKGKACLEQLCDFVPDLLAVDHYVIKWSSVLHPQSTERSVSVDQVSYTIEQCKPGTRHFIAVAAIDNHGKLVSKSPQLTIQTSAPLAAPRLRLSSSLPSSIQLEWDKPIPVGDASVHSYEIMVDDIIRTTLDNSKLSFEWRSCTPCITYDFQIRVLSTKEGCHSNWSEILPVTCPGADVPVISRVPSNHINCIHVSWDTPILVGGATLNSYKVHYLAKEEAELTSDIIVNDPAIITHGPLKDIHEDTLDNANPTLPYWVVLEVNLLPEGCETVFSQPIKTKVAVPPDAPQISVTVVGLKERRTLERFVCGLAQIKDKICLKLQLLQNSVIVKGSKQKEDQISKNRSTVRNLEVELKHCTQDIKCLTGVVNADVEWTIPCDDSDAVVTGYQVFIDGEKHGGPLDSDTLYTSVELSASSHDHVITVKTLTNHPVGHSVPSNAVTVHAQHFLPFVQFCYFKVHSASAGCCYEDNLCHEIQNNLVSTHRGSLGKPLPSPVCNVTDVIELGTKCLVPLSEKPRAILFWTIWCHSSIKAMEMFIQFSRDYDQGLDFTTCCVKSGSLASGHHQSLYDLLTSRGWLSQATNIQHTCGCHANDQRSSFQRSVGRAEISDVSDMFGLVGVPTIVLCNKDGYIIWQGRCCIQEYSEYQQFMYHSISEASKQSCPVTNCTQCSLDHELNTMELNGFSSQIPRDHPSESFKYKRAKRDSSLEVTGQLSMARQKMLPAIAHDEVNRSKDKTGLTGLARHDGKLLNERSSYKNVHPCMIEEMEYLHRRLHGTNPQHTFDHQPTRPQTTQSTSHHNIKTQRDYASSKNTKSVRISLTSERAKSAYQTRTSIFKDRFSSSMISTLPSLGLSNERTLPKTRHRSATSKSKSKISVEEFSPT